MQATFDFEASQQAKEIGMQSAAESLAAGGVLALARNIARRLATLNGETHADIVGVVLEHEHGIKSMGPAAGSLFREPCWEFTGRRIVSSRVSNHGRELKIWKLKPQN